MKESVEVKISHKTINLLKMFIGKRIIKIGYVDDPLFSPATVIFFESGTVKIVNTATPHLPYDYEYPHISAVEAMVLDDIAFDNQVYHYIKIDKIVAEIKAIQDIVTWELDGEQGSLSIQNGIVLLAGNETQIVFYAFDSIAECTGIYDSIDQFQTANPIDHIWGIEANHTNYQRLIHAI